MTGDHIKPMSAGWHKRQRVHRHNAFTGHVAMMRSQLNNIMAADSVSIEAKRVAHAISGLVDQLGDLIKQRIDP